MEAPQAGCFAMPLDNSGYEFQNDLIATQQARLADLGYYRGKIDGKALIATAKAMTDFKVNNGLRERAYPGPVTMTRLWGSDALPCPKPAVKDDEPLWLAEARRLLGTREYSGSANNPTIMNWARDLDQWYTGDDVPWCGLFVAHITAFAAPNQPQDFNRLGARQWLNYGKTVTKDKWGDLPLGGICVLWRTHPTRSWNGHVFTITGQSSDAVRGIGGNQSNNVTEAWFDRDRILGVVGPENWTHTSAPQAKTGALSTNEA